MRSVAILFTLFIIAIVILADTGHLPRFIRGIYDVPDGDKLGHFVLFGLLNFFMTMTLIRPSPDPTAKWAALGTGLVLALLIALEEYSQKFFARRTFDLIDVLASYLGLIAGGWMAYKTKSPKGFKAL